MVKNTGPLKITEILSADTGHLVQLYSHTRELSALEKKLCSYLPASLRDHVRVANYDEKSLSLCTDNAAWATRLRFKIPDILNIARNKCMLDSIQTVRISVAPTEKETSNRRQAPRLTSETAQLLRSTAESLSDPDLRQALLQLSQHSKD